MSDDDTSSVNSYNTADLPLPNFPPPPLPAMSHQKLPVFWTDSPVAWFVAVKAQIRLRRMVSQDEPFYHVTAALDKQSLKRVVHLVVTPDPVQPNSKLKEALLASHQLTNFQRVELLHTIEPLGSSKPSELLADMLELKINTPISSLLSSSCSASLGTSACSSPTRTTPTCRA